VTARAAVQSILESDSALAALGFLSIFGSNAADTVPDDRFIICHWSTGAAAFSDRGTDSLFIWAHDKDRDYTAIDAALSRIKDLLLNAVHVVGADGRTLTQATLVGWSDDIYDDGYATCTKNIELRIASR